MPALVVIGDSLTFHGPERAHPHTEPGLFPNQAALALTRATGAEWSADVAAGMGWTAREAWWAVTKDPRLWGELLPSADAIVISVGGMDALPAAVPTVFRESIRYIRPGWLRRGVRSAYNLGAPAAIRATGGRMRQLPQHATEHYLSRIVAGIRYFRPDVPILLLGPAPHAAAAYPSQRPYASARQASREWAMREDVAWVDSEPLVRPELAPEGSSNPDGMHWGWPVHQGIGEAIAAELLGPLQAGASGAGALRTRSSS